MRSGPPLWLVLLGALALRSVGLDAPILGEHAWKEADTAAIARNFDEGGLQLLHPRIDWGGATSGEVESEFPLYPFLVALLYRGFGPSEAWARLLSACCSVASIGFVYGLARAHVGVPTARWAAFFLAFLPLYTFFGRAVIPEALMLAAGTGGLFFFSRWTRGGAAIDFTAAALGIAIAGMVKPPALCLGAPLAFLAWQPGRRAGGAGRGRSGRRPAPAWLDAGRARAAARARRRPRDRVRGRRRDRGPTAWRTVAARSYS